jgi:addiction module RelE/StbE family toxin
MVKRKVIWSTLAKLETKEILEYFLHRNKSATYSRKLYQLFQSELRRLSMFPEAGLKTKLTNVRGLVVKDYILFYEVFDDRIVVLKVWDCRQNPDKLIIPY